MKLFRLAVILSHRYLGIVLSVLVIMWFATGITMIYWGGMPRVTPELRLTRLEPVNMANVHLTPAQALARAELDRPGRVTLTTVLQRPVYRFGGREATMVFADNGEILDEFSVSQSQAIAASFAQAPLDRVHHLRTLNEVDQWTLQSPLPLHQFAVDDGAGTELYVYPYTGDVVMMTTRSSRGWAWASTIPHWMYFTVLRTNQPLWARVLVWTSALACVLAILGLVLGITQRRRPRPFRLAAAIPYSGPMRWHYISGVVFGLFTLTFAFSGIVSMEPWAWTNSRALDVPGTALSGGPIDLARYATWDPASWSRVLGGSPAKEVELARMLGEPYYIVRRGSVARDETGDRERLHQPYPIRHHRIEENRLLVAADTFAPRRDLFDQAAMLSAIQSATPNAHIVESTLLTEYDSYYYSRIGLLPLPTLRIKFDDPAETWAYVDPALSELVTAIGRWNRVERWAYHGLHSLDFGYLYNSRPAWDVVMIALCLGGLASSSLGLVMGVRRMRRATRRAAASLDWGPQPDGTPARR